MKALAQAHQIEQIDPLLDAVVGRGAREDHGQRDVLQRVMTGSG